MKVLLIDCAWDGHHKKYFSSIYYGLSCDKKCVLPKFDNEFIEASIVPLKSGFVGYIKYMDTIRKIAKSYRPDVIVFLFADITYKYFGLGLSFLSKYKTIFAFHNMRESFLKNISRKLISRYVSYIIVHLRLFEKYLNRIGISNVEYIQYPSFWSKRDIDTFNELKMKNTNETQQISLLLIGSMRQEKGYKYLIDSAVELNGRFVITIAGDTSHIDRDEFYEMVSRADNISVVDKVLSESEYLELLSKADYLVLPYSRQFSANSGALTDAVTMSLPVIASDLPTLGNLVRDNHLGMVFEPENSKDLTKTINSITSKSFEYDNVANDYRDSVSLEVFVKNYIRIIGG